MRPVNPLLTYPTELEEGIKQFQEVFIEFYGEENRKEIEEVFQKIVCIGYQPPEIIKAILSAENTDLTNTLIGEVIEKSGTKLTRGVLLDNSSLKHYENHPIFLYGLLRESHHLGKEGRVNQFFKEGFRELKKSAPDITWEDFHQMVRTGTLLDSCKDYPGWLKDNILYYINPENEKTQYRRLYKRCEQLLKKVNPDITFETLDANFDSLEELDEVLVHYLNALKEYKETMSYYQDWQEELDHLDQTSYVLKHKYYKELIKESMDLIPEDKRSGIEEYLADDNKKYLLNSIVTYLLGSNVDSQSDLEAFQSKFDEMLASSETSEYIKKGIMERRIRYFNRFGIHLGDHYEAYEQSKEAKAIWPDSLRVNRFVDTKRSLFNDYNNEFYPHSSEYQRGEEILSHYDFLDKDNLLDAKDFYQQTICVTPNIIKKEDHYELIPLLFVNFHNAFWDRFDHFLVHELNHILELHLIGTTPYTYTYACGWEIFEEFMNQERKSPVDTITEPEKREYEVLNECINEMISQEISDRMNKKGIHIFNSSNKSTYKHVVKNESQFYLVREFYEEFKKIILKSRRNGNREFILNAVGKENLVALNDLVARAYHGEDDGSFEEKKNEILEKMRQHQEPKKEEVLI